MNHRAVLLVVGCVWLWVSSTLASQVRSINLEQMTARAATIFSGRCIAVEIVSDPTLGRDVGVAKFEVHRAIKGASGPIVTVRMVTDDDGGGRSVADVPAFRVGEEAVLFLYEESALGLRAPVGLGQGRFRVVIDKQGHEIAINEVANRNLLSAISPTAQGRLARFSARSKAQHEVGPNELLDMVEALLVVGP